jgi:hypothetical protein
MRARSWMAALALIGTASILLIGRGWSAQAPGSTQESGRAKEAKGSPTEEKTGPESTRDESKSGSQAEKRKASASQFPAIQLDLVIAGLGTEGCDVEVKPANAGCRFRPSSAQHVPSDGRATIKLRDVELRGADKTCIMAITVREPGQPSQTIYRGFRPGSSKTGTIPSFTCYVSSKLAGADAKATRK